MIIIPVSVIILTHNEEKNIENCLKSVYGWVEEIIIVDSYSTDSTLEIVRKYTDKIYQHSFKTQAEQFNWALDNVPLKTDWIIRLDSDEIITSKLCKELSDKLCKTPDKITGLYVKRRVYFMGRWIKHGGYYPIWLLRIFRKGKARCEQKDMDEHILILEGRTDKLDNDIIDENHKGLSFLIEKHNRFASREMMDTMNSRCAKEGHTLEPHLFGDVVQRKRWFKQHIYLKLPLFLRASLYFIYRYFIKFGFLDGKEGLIFHFLQGFWYRFLVDVKIYEYNKVKKPN